MQMQSVVAVPARELHGRLPLLRGWRLWLLLSSTMLAAGVAWQWTWLAAIGVVPVLLSVAPCAAMCALGLCAGKLAGGSCKASSSGSEPSSTTAPLGTQNDTPEAQIRN